MDWTQITTTLIETGGLATILIVLVTLTEKKGAAMLENAKALAQSYKELADEYQKREAATNSLLADKERELLNQIKMNSSLRHSLDDAHTECAVSRLMYCKKAKCIDRDPPFGSNADIVVKESKEKTRNSYQKQAGDGNYQRQLGDGYHK